MYKQFNIWINVEFGFFGGTLIAYSVYFLLRSFFEQRLSVQIKIALHNPETDFIVAEQNVIATIVTFVAPAVVWLFFYAKYQD